MTWGRKPSSICYLAAHYRLQRLQRAAGFVLAFMPWLGVTIGLFAARNFVVARYNKLLNDVCVAPVDLDAMHPLLHVSNMQVAGAIIGVGAAAFFVSIDERNRLAHYALACIAPVLAAMLFLLFTDRLNPNAWTLLPLWVYAAILAAAFGYFLIYERLYHQQGSFWFLRPFVRTGIGFRKRRQRRLALWVLLPWFGLAIYFLLFGNFVPGAAASSGCPHRALSAAAPNPGRWAIFPVAMCCTIAIGLLTGHFLARLAPINRRRMVIVTIVVLAVLAASLSWHDDPGLIVRVYRSIGPLAAISLEFLFLIATFSVLALVSRNSGFPALTLLVLTIAFCIMFPSYAKGTAVVLAMVYATFALLAFFSLRIRTGLIMLLLIFAVGINLWQLTQGISVSQNPADPSAVAATDNAVSPPTVQTAYLCWLDQRGIPAAKTSEQKITCNARPDHLPAVNGRYPVFIVAAEGGGIYAASAAATFLAQLEDREPGLAQHIFAISGVSGGSIGASVFHALDRARKPDGVSKSTRSLSASVKNIMQDDHLSPIVGAIFPEIFGLPMKRPDALTASFDYSTSTQDAVAGRNLRGHFNEHWSPAGAVPALVLNTTWVETGFRVAFAPFGLHELNGSLYSFLDPMMPDECPNKKDSSSCISLMTAAGASARFPGLMPPFSVKLNGETRWNFVDGAYSDNSGLTTALDIFHALKDVNNKKDVNNGAFLSDAVDLRIVVITSSQTHPNLTDGSVSGTAFLDTLAPIDAIIKVSKGLANEALGRACSEFYPGEHEGCIEHTGKDGELQIVEIDDQTYGLPLGWKISQTSFSVIQQMLGGAVACDQSSNRNSCVSRLLVELVRKSVAP